MSASTLQTQARNAYKAKEYASAAVLFDRAIGRAPSVQLYDNRAACHVKLDNLPAALKDAKNAINLSREDATGYLRAGSILTKMDKPNVALDIYAHGLKCVRPVGAGYEQLKKMHDLSLGQCAPKNSVDPMTRLPRELALQVLEYLTFRERIKVSRTSKGWTDFIKSEPRLWQDLNLSGGRTNRKVPTSFISKAINIAKKKLKAATLHNLYDFDKVLSALSRHCPIEKLTLGDTGLRGIELARLLEPVTTQLKELRILSGTEIGETVLRRVLQQHHSCLEVLHAAHIKRLGSRYSWQPVLSDLPRIREFELTIGYSEANLAEEFLEALAVGAPSLERLRFHQQIGGGQLRPGLLNLSACEKLIHLDIQALPSSLSAESHISLPKGLKYLRLATLSGIVRPEFFAEDSMQFANLPNLEEAHIIVPGLNFDRLISLFAAHPTSEGELKGASPVRSLSMLRTSIPGNATLDLPLRLRSLEHLSLRECLDLTDDIIEKIVAQLPVLKVLDVSGSRITGASVKTIVQGGRLSKIERAAINREKGGLDTSKSGKIVADDIKLEPGMNVPVKERVMIRELILNDCPDLGRDAVDWARAMGIKVEYKMASFEKAKKVRY